MNLEGLSPEHQIIANQARERIMAYIAGTALAPILENPQPNIGYDDEVVS